MRTSKRTKSVYGIWWVLAGGIAALSACGGGGDENPVPPNSSVQIDPAKVEWMISPVGTTCTFFPTLYNDSLISIKVLDGNGSPLGKVRLTMSLDLAGNTFGGGVEYLTLYEDKNANGKIDDPQEKVSSNQSPIFVTETNEFTGDKQLFVRVNLSCPFKGNLNVFTSGNASGQLNLSVQERT